MILYWSQTRLADALVRAQAESMTIDPIRFSFDDELISVHARTASGGSYERIFADYLSLRLVVSWDELRRSLTLVGVTQTVERWMRTWEDAPFRWIEGATLDGTLLNGGDPLAVMLAEAPIRRRINDRDDQKEFEYLLAEKEIHVHES